MVNEMNIPDLSSKSDMAKMVKINTGEKVTPDDVEKYVNDLFSTKAPELNKYLVINHSVHPPKKLNFGAICVMTKSREDAKHIAAKFPKTKVGTGYRAVHLMAETVLDETSQGEG